MGVSPRQLWNMKKFYERYAGHDEKVLRSVALLPWSHNLPLLSKGLNDEATLYYAQETVAKGWNRDLLLFLEYHLHSFISIIYKIGKYKEKRTKDVDTSRMGVN